MARCYDCAKRIWPGQGQIIWWLSKTSPLCDACADAAQASRQGPAEDGRHRWSSLHQPPKAACCE